MVVNHEGDIVRRPRHKGTITKRLPQGTITQRLPQGTITQRLPGKDRIVGKSKSTRSRQQDSVDAGFARARKAWREYEANRKVDKNAVYIYLQAVFDVVQEWKEMGMANEYSLQALKQHDFPIRMKPDPYARVIYCTSEVDAKTRSKWAKIMQWVARSNKRGRSFTEFVTKNGGLNRCAENKAGGGRPNWM